LCGTLDEPSTGFGGLHGIWNDWNKAFDPGYADMACSANYIMSHDVADRSCLINIRLGPMLQATGIGEGGGQNVGSVIDSADTSSNLMLQATGGTNPGF
jgi:hypothetical protein